MSSFVISTFFFYLGGSWSFSISFTRLLKRATLEFYVKYLILLKYDILTKNTRKTHSLLKKNASVDIKIQLWVNLDPQVMKFDANQYFVGGVEGT